jgi:outer membrane protein TolC
MRRRLTGPLLALLVPALIRGQQAPPAGGEAFLGGVPEGQPVAQVVDLSLGEVLRRGLAHNLGLLLAQAHVQSAEGSRWKALADLLPSLSAQGTGTREKLNLAVFGFTLPGVPSLVGPFNVYDFRVGVRSQIVDLKAVHALRAEGEGLEAARSSRKDAEGLVILVCGSLYLQVVSAESRVEAERAQLETAKALHTLARDRKEAGSAPGIDVLRAEVALRSREQQLIVAENAVAKSRLALARAIGLPLGQEFRLTDRVPYAELPSIPLEAGLERAYRDRADWKAALALVRAAEQSRAAASGEYLPTLALEADIGRIGQTFDSLKTTYTLEAALRVPIFEGGRTHGKVLEAEARLRSQKDALEDLRVRIELDVRSAILDLTAAGERVRVAQAAGELAKDQLTQAQDRFAAGVAGNLEVVQAQESLASATDNQITSLYDFNLAKATLARALGAAESAYGEVVKGE